jgi:hypothetical protein
LNLFFAGSEVTAAPLGISVNPSVEANAAIGSAMTVAPCVEALADVG